MNRKIFHIPRQALNALETKTVLGLFLGLLFLIAFLLISCIQRVPKNVNLQESEPLLSTVVAEQSPSPTSAVAESEFSQSATQQPLLILTPTTTIVSGQPVPTAGWRTYTNEEFEFTIKYPPELKVDRESWVRVYSNEKGYWYLGISDRSGNLSRTSQEYVSVHIKPNAKTVRGKPLIDIEDSFIGPETPTFYTHQNYPALRFEHEVLGPSRGKIITIHILKDGILWKIDGAVFEGKLAKYEEIEQILSTFRFLDKD